MRRIPLYMATHGKGQSITKSISLNAELWERIEAKLATMKVRGFSEYCQILLEHDLDTGGRVSRGYMPGTPIPYPEHTPQAMPVAEMPEAKRGKRKAG